MYFADDEIQKLLNRSISTLSGIPNDQFGNLKLETIIKLLDFIRINPTLWDEYTKVSIENVGENFRGRLVGLTLQSSKLEIDWIFAYLFWFVEEFNLSTKGALPDDVGRLRQIAIKTTSLEPEPAEYIKTVSLQLPTIILKNLLNSNDLKIISESIKYTSDAKQAISDWDSELKKFEGRVNNLKKNLSDYETKYNFIGLNLGFQKLWETKTKEKKDIVGWVKFFGILIIFPAMLELIFINYADRKPFTLVASTLSAASMTLILIYFFRIVLHNYKSLNSQLLQLDLRMTLCQFIQSYTSYSQDIKERDPESLARFESIVFSGLAADDSAMPNTFDGIEAIANLIKSVKSS